MRANPFDLGRLLAPVGVERFFAEYWQQRTLSLQLETNDFSQLLREVGALDIARIAALAQEGTRAWIANDYVAHSVIPVDASNAASFFKIGATLYFVNVRLEGLIKPLAAFLGAPAQNIIASLFLTPASGGASPHFDKNENFTVQLTGAKRWIVGDTPRVPATPAGYVMGQRVPPSLAGLLDTAKQEASHTIEMQPGTLLYVPRGTVHWTEAGQPSWSLNLSYGSKTWIDLVCAGLRRRLGGSARWRSSVTGVGGGCDPAALKANLLPELVAELREMLSDPAEIDHIARAFFENPNS
jgi:ribosomal protein L16 Arg81 hydroxylase